MPSMLHLELNQKTFFFAKLLRISRKNYQDFRVETSLTAYSFAIIKEIFSS